MSHKLDPEKELEYFLETIAEASRHVRSLLFILFLSSIYVVVAAYTGDWQSETLILPIVEAEISRRWFFIISPIFILFNYVYMHLYLKDLIKRGEMFYNLPIETSFVAKNYLGFPWILPMEEGDRDPKTRSLSRKFMNFCLDIAFWWYGPAVLLAILMAYIFQQDIAALVPYICFCLSILHYFMNSRFEKSTYKKFLTAYLSAFLFFITLTAVPAIPMFFGFAAIDNELLAATVRAFITGYVVIYCVFFGLPKTFKSDKSIRRKAAWVIFYVFLIVTFTLNLMREHQVPFE